METSQSRNIGNSTSAMSPNSASSPSLLKNGGNLYRAGGPEYFSYVMENISATKRLKWENHELHGTDFPVPPNDFDTTLYASQLLQAEAIRYGVEHFRRNRGRCMGTVIRQLNDCWPVASWSSIDYCGRWKALHYYAKRFFRPGDAFLCRGRHPHPGHQPQCRALRGKKNPSICAWQTKPCRNSSCAWSGRSEITDPKSCVPAAKK